MVIGVDTDGDGMIDADELSHTCLDRLTADAGADPDNDGLTSLEELGLGTSPCNEDSDLDALSDGQEVLLIGTDPLSPDTDSDGLADGAEVNKHQTDPFEPDSDLDSCLDGVEIRPKSAAYEGGGRDPLFFWDFFDQWTGSPPQRDRSVTGGDIGALVVRFGSVHPGGVPTKQEAVTEALTPPTVSSGYHTSADRGGAIPEQNPWNLLPPDGGITGGDISAVVAQFGHTCV